MQIEATIGAVMGGSAASVMKLNEYASASHA